MAIKFRTAKKGWVFIKKRDNKFSLMNWKEPRRQIFWCVERNMMTAQNTHTGSTGKKKSQPSSHEIFLASVNTKVKRNGWNEKNWEDKYKMTAQNIHRQLCQASLRVMRLFPARVNTKVKRKCDKSIWTNWKELRRQIYDDDTEYTQAALASKPAFKSWNIFLQRSNRYFQCSVSVQKWEESVTNLNGWIKRTNILMTAQNTHTQHWQASLQVMRYSLAKVNWIFSCKRQLNIFLHRSKRHVLASVKNQADSWNWSIDGHVHDLAYLPSQTTHYSARNTKYTIYIFHIFCAKQKKQSNMIKLQHL